MTRPCSVDGCGRGVHARELCEMHYRRLTRTGSIRGDEPERDQRRVPGPDMERFTSSYVVADDGCWLWARACTTRGYPEFQSDGRTVYAHRWSYEHHVGPIDEGLTIDHMCHNADLSCGGGDACAHRRCVNPAHLEPASHLVNNRRARARERARKVAS